MWSQMQNEYISWKTIYKYNLIKLKSSLLLLSLLEYINALNKYKPRKKNMI